MKRMQKYFLAIVPAGAIQENCLEIKNLIKENFNVKYGLKSPAHITLKMPFSYNEAKELELIGNLEKFLIRFDPFDLQIGGVGTFGRRVIFLKVPGGDPLFHLQRELRDFCGRELKLVVELSDRNYEPHLTIAFKDLKDQHFHDITKLVEKLAIPREFFVEEIHLLKRLDGRWVSRSKIPTGGLSH